MLVSLFAPIFVVVVSSSALSPALNTPTTRFAFLSPSWKPHQTGHLHLLHSPSIHLNSLARDCLSNMPKSRSSRSSKGSRPSLLSMPSVSNLLSTVSHSKEHHDDSVGLGQPTKDHRLDTADESGSKPQRTKSKLNVLTSLFTPTRSDSKLSISAIDARRPKTAQEALPPTHIREKPIHRKPVASTLECSTHSSLDETTPRTPSNTHGSISTVDNSPGAVGLGVNTPSTQVSDFDFGFERTQSPEETGRPSHGQNGAEMPIQKPQLGVSSTHGPPDRAPPVPPKLELPPQTHQAFQMTETPASPILSRKRSSSAHPRPIAETQNGRNKLQPSRRPSSPSVTPRPRSSSAHSHVNHTRTVSTPVDHRPLSKHSNDGDNRGRLRRSWLPGGRSRSASKDLKKMAPNKAWIMSQDNHVDYNTQFLTNGEKVIPASVLSRQVTNILMVNRSLNFGTKMGLCWYICSQRVAGRGRPSRFQHRLWKHR